MRALLQPAASASASPAIKTRHVAPPVGPIGNLSIVVNNRHLSGASARQRRGTATTAPPKAAADAPAGG